MNSETKKKIGRPSSGDKARLYTYALKLSLIELNKLKQAAAVIGDCPAKLARDCILKRVNKILKE